jgi:CHAT domain-containing protein
VGPAFYGFGHPYDAEAEGDVGHGATSPLARLERARGGSRQPLPGSAREILGIAALFAAPGVERETIAAASAELARNERSRETDVLAGEQFRVMLRERANEHTLKSDPAVKSSRIVHLACHGEPDTTSPQLSRLVLARAPSLEKATGEDGYVYVHELRDLDLHCELLVLSACESTTGKLSAVEGMTGLARAGLAGGAQAVMSTLWQVQDEGAHRLMQSFYERLRSGGVTRIRALGNTKRAAIAAGLPVRAWSAYILWDAQTDA